MSFLMIEFNKPNTTNSHHLFCRENFDSYKDFAIRYLNLKENNKLNTVKRFCFIECNFIHEMSSLKLADVLKKGFEPDFGVVLKNEDSFFTHEGFWTKNIENAFLMTEDEAKSLILSFKQSTGKKPTHYVAYSKTQGE